MRQFAAAVTEHAERPLLEISSFAYREGIPPDADLVFDARILPNPFYEPGLAVLTGRDAPVIDYLRAQPETAALVDAIATYVRASLPGFVRTTAPGSTLPSAAPAASIAPFTSPMR